MSTQPQQPPEPSGKAGRAFALVVTNTTKLAGVAVAINEALIRTQARPIVIAVSALMIAGVQALETFIDRLFGR
jgi:hypothetical protein